MSSLGDCSRCDKDAVVGIGPEKTPMCIEHMNETFIGIRRAIDTAAKEVFNADAD